MAQKPVVLPDVFTGEKSWDEWIDHFAGVAAVNAWEDEAKLQWLRVRLTGRAATAFRRLPEETRGDFAAATAALRERFEPESKKELYMAEMQTRSKKRKEDWAAFGEELKLLADKAYPDLQDEARERLALNQYLARLDDPQLGFSVRQSKPKSVDEAIRVTLEMESYMQASKSATPVQISQVQLEDNEAPATVAAATSKKPGDPLQQILQQMEELKAGLEAVQQQRPQRNNTGTARSNFANERRCFNCRGKGHISSNCPSPRRKPQQQGNEQPSDQ